MKKYLLSTIILLSAIIYQPLFSQNVTPAENNGKFNFQFANVYFEVNPAMGGRINSFKIDGVEQLYNTGSTFWPSPQTWPWPPAAAVDKDLYTGGISGDSVSIISGVANFGGKHVKVRKTFHASASDTSVTIKYTLINTDANAKSHAAWEITRVPVVGGLFFFPYGDGEFAENSYGDDLPNNTERINNAAWYTYRGTEAPHQKLFSDGKYGWLAYLSGTDYLFIKKFDDIPANQQADAESEIEVYFGGAFFELENQGAYVEVPAGGSIEYTVKWYIRNAAGIADKKAGSTELLNYVSKVTNTTPLLVSAIKE